MELSNEELDSILARAGLKLAQPYHPSGEYRNDDYLLTSCVRCGVEAHYKLKYIRHKNKIGERVCRACYWLAWYGSARRLYDRGVQKLIERGYSRRELIEQGVLREKRGVDWGEAERLASRHGYELVDLLHGDRTGDDVLVVRCRACGRLLPERPADVSFGCQCRETTKKGVAFGDEVRQVETPHVDRKTSPRTPGTASLIARVERCAADSSRYTYAQVKGKLVTDFPELIAAWDDESSPEGVPIASSRLRHFCCPNGHRPNQTPYSYLVDGCMVCRGLRTKAAADQVNLRGTNPELAEEWLEAVDGARYTPDTVKSGSKRLVRWRCLACGYEWRATVRDREKRMNNRCPSCGKIMGSLAWQYPELAREWSSSNPISPWNIKPYSKLNFKPEWVSATDSSRVWRETVALRIKHSGE